MCTAKGLDVHPGVPLASLGLRLFCVAGVGQCALPRGRMYALASLWRPWVSASFERHRWCYPSFDATPEPQLIHEAEGPRYRTQQLLDLLPAKVGEPGQCDLVRTGSSESFLHTALTGPNLPKHGLGRYCRMSNWNTHVPLVPHYTFRENQEK